MMFSLNNKCLLALLVLLCCHPSVAALQNPNLFPPDPDGWRYVHTSPEKSFQSYDFIGFLFRSSPVFIAVTFLWLLTLIGLVVQLSEMCLGFVVEQLEGYGQVRESNPKLFKLYNLVLTMEGFEIHIMSKIIYPVERLTSILGWVLILPILFLLKKKH